MSESNDKLTNYVNDSEIERGGDVSSEIYDVWKLSEFTNRFNLHYKQKYNIDKNITQNTINNYFRELEKRNIHYINKIEGIKVYDALDMAIVEFIAFKREKELNNAWSLEEIFKVLPKEIECRPFPLGEQNDDPTNVNLKELFNDFKQEMSAQLSEFEESLQQKQLLQIETSEAQTATKVRKEYVEIMQKQRDLKDEARKAWDNLPADERLEGFIFKKERVRERERFIDDFVDRKLMEWMITSDELIENDDK